MAINKKRMSRKAYFFTLDAIIALGIIAASLALASFYYQSKEKTTTINLLADDLTTTFAFLSINKTNNSYVEDLIANGTITDLNNTVLEQIGEFWAQNMTNEAQNMIENLTYGLIPSTYGFGFWIDNDPVYAKNITGSVTALTTSKKMISGYEKDKPTEGYVSRAWARTALKNMTKSFPFYVQGAGFQGGGGVTFTKKFNLNASEILNAKFYISIHYGISNINSMKFKINGNDLDPNWIYIEERIVGADTTHVAFGLVDDCVSFIQSGENTVEVYLVSQSPYPAYINPGMRLDVTYKVESGYYQDPRIKTYYFDNIKSLETGDKKSGVWAIMPIHIKKGRPLESVIFHLKAQDIENISDIPPNVSQYNIQIYLDNKTIDLFNPSSSNETVEKTYNLTNNVTEGDNILAIYLNSYITTPWGNGDTILYSDSVNDPDGSSYVEVKYGKEVAEEIKYGVIDVSFVEEIGGIKNSTKTYPLNVTKEILQAFVQLAQLDSLDLSLYVDNGQSNNFIFNTPRELSTPSKIYVDPIYIRTGNINLFNITDTCPSCHVLPESAIEYLANIPALVSYGEVFTTQQEAEDDALQRLNESIGQYAQIITFELDSNQVQDIPTLWGPAIAEVRIWQ
ncbi:hypothetical protein KY331_03820 [Candidatus Woesearchaeota archaeon]|nr:hypothetical protein [Candidatus Woesearchaeota archaeon]